MTSLDRLKLICNDACHERKACAQGHTEIMQAESVTALAYVWRRYWSEFISDQYADIIRVNLPAVYPDIREGMIAAQVYFNECPKDAIQTPFVIVGDSDSPVHIYGYAVCHVLGNAHVIAHDHTRIYCSQADGKVELMDWSYGDVSAGYAIAHNHSTLDARTECECYNASNVRISAGTLHDYGHFSIWAHNDAMVDSFTNMKINLYNNAKLTIRKQQ